MKNNINKINFYGILAAIVSGLFGTLNLSFNKFNPLITLIFYGLTIISVSIILFFLFAKNNKSDISKINDIIDVKEKIDFIKYSEMKEKQLSISENILFRMKRQILNIFCESLLIYCQGNNILINENIEQTEACFYYNEILNEISEENRKLLKSTLEKNKFASLNDNDFDLYKKEKIDLFFAVAESVRNIKYNENICIIPHVMEKKQNKEKIYSTCQIHIDELFSQIRKISMESVNKINDLENNLNILKKQII